MVRTITAAALLAGVSSLAAAAPALTARGQQPLLQSDGIKLVARSFSADSPVQGFYVSSSRTGAGIAALTLVDNSTAAAIFYANGTAEEVQSGHARLVEPLGPDGSTSNSVVMPDNYNDTTHSLTTYAELHFAASNYSLGTPGFNNTIGGNDGYYFPEIEYTYDPQFGQWFACYMRLTYDTAWALGWHSKYGSTPEGCAPVFLVPECAGDITFACERPFKQSSQCWQDAKDAPLPVDK